MNTFGYCGFLKTILASADVRVKAESMGQKTV